MRIQINMNLIQSTKTINFRVVIPELNLSVMLSIKQPQFPIPNSSGPTLTRHVTSISELARNALQTIPKNA